MTLNQRVPSTAVGGMAQWSRAFGSRQFFSAGTDWRWVDGDSEEDGLDAATGTQVTLEAQLGWHAAQPRPVRPGRHLADATA